MRNKDHPGNVDAEAGRHILLSFLDYDNDFSPFDANEPSVKHWESQRLFFQYPFPVWEAVARKLMVHARQLIPQNTQDIPNSLLEVKDTHKTRQTKDSERQSKDRGTNQE